MALGKTGIMFKSASLSSSFLQNAIHKVICHVKNDFKVKGRSSCFWDLLLMFRP
jgi:hypothetical protein